MFLTKISRTTSKLILTLTLYWIHTIFQLLLVSGRIQCLQIMYITMVKLLFIFKQIWCYSLQFFLENKREKKEMFSNRAGQRRNTWFLFSNGNNCLLFLLQLETLESEHLLLFTSYKSFTLILDLIVGCWRSGRRKACNFAGCF